MTKKLFQDDVYKKECKSTVSAVRGSGTPEDPFLLTLEETIFFPTGGGQPCDLGTINEIPLTEVFEKDDEIWHKLLPVHPSDAPASSTAWHPGDAAFCRLDWDRRFMNMQRHCGEHILSGIFFRETGGVNRGFHMGKGYMTIDIDVPGITWEQAQEIERLTNEVIWSNAPVTTRYYSNRAEAEKLPLRKALAIDEDISIVCVGDENNPADCVACCGTHPGTSGQVGLLKIFRLENYKGMTRVYFDAGQAAFEDYRSKQRILTELNQKYSSDDNDLLDKMKAQEEKNKEARQELHILRSALIAKAVEEISESRETPVVREYPYFNANDLMAVSKTLTEKPDGPRSAKSALPPAAGQNGRPLFALISTRENVVILASAGGHDCGKIIKDNAHVWGGKGGGNPSNARVMFPSRENLECFISYIRQAH